jgi:predicted phosphodiesterase
VSAGLYAVSDLHVDHAENREFVQRIRPHAEGDWLIVAGDRAGFEWAPRLLGECSERLIWAPGNHELLTYKDDHPDPFPASRQDGVRFEEVSIGCPRERARRPASRPGPRRILPEVGRA